MVLLPLQFGMPGGPELWMILSMLVMMGLPVLLIVLAVVAAVKLLGGSDDERVRELEQRVARLEGQVDSSRETTRGTVESGDENHGDEARAGSSTLGDRE